MNNLRIIAVTNEELVLSVSAMGDCILRDYFSSFSDKQLDDMLENSFSPDALISEINNGHEYFLISSDYTFAGFSSVLEKDDLLLLDKLYLDPELASQEIYTVMIKKYIELCQLRGLKKIQLLCDKNNTAALNIYKQSGFEITGNTVLKLNDDFEIDHYVMEYTI